MIIVICGYARAGKTTALEHFRSRGWTVLSSSEAIHLITRDLFSLFDLALDTSDKEAVIHTCMCQERGDASSNKMTTRQAMVGVAEQVLVKNLGRGAIVRGLARQAMITRGNAVIEVFNQEEYDILLEEKVWVDWLVAIRSSREQPFVDSRNLVSGAIELRNDGTLDELYQKLDRLF